jgi:hypothetical protein
MNKHLSQLSKKYIKDMMLNNFIQKPVNLCSELDSVVLFILLCLEKKIFNGLKFSILFFGLLFVMIVFLFVLVLNSIQYYFDLVFGLFGEEHVQDTKVSAVLSE